MALGGSRAKDNNINGVWSIYTRNNWKLPIQGWKTEEIRCVKAKNDFDFKNDAKFSDWYVLGQVCPSASLKRKPVTNMNSIIPCRSPSRC